MWVDIPKNPEEKEIKEEKIKKFIQDLKDDLWTITEENPKVNVFFDWKKDVFAIDRKWDWTVGWYFYYDDRWVIRDSFYPKWAKETIKDKKSYLQAGFIAKDGDASNNLYKIISQDNGNIVLNTKPLDQFSFEYYNAWVDILFYDTYKELKTSEKKLNWLPKIPLQDITITETTIYPIWAMRIQDLEWYLKKWAISDLWFDLLMDEVFINWWIILKQCDDPRFDKVWDPITVEEINGYVERKRISRELGNQCIELIKARDEKILKQQNLNKNIKWDFASLKSSISNLG